jgi:hypothetical protein
MANLCQKLSLFILQVSDIVKKKYQGTLVSSPAKANSPRTIKHIVPKEFILNME